MDQEQKAQKNYITALKKNKNKIREKNVAQI